MATSVVRSPRYWGHFFLPPGKTTIRFLWEKKTLVNTVTPLIRPNIFWPIGDRINGVPNQNFRNRQLLPRLQRSRREALEADNFLSGRKILCSLTAIPRQVILQKNFLQLTFLAIRKISRLICEQGCENEKSVITKFSNCLQTPNSIFRPNVNKASVRFKRLP